MINFMIPGMYEHYQTICCFLEELRSHPEYFYDNINIGAVYGNFQFCIWDGGRIFSNYKHTTLEEIQYVKNLYNNEFKIPIRFVFTSTILEEKHLSDRFCNMILRECENDINEIVVNSPILENYIRKNYPKYKIISSTTKCLSKPEDFKLEIMNPNYHLVCLDYNLNKNINLLDTLNEEEKARCEFLVNAICPPSCPSRKEHYKLNSLFYLNYGRPYKTKVCGITTSNLNPTVNVANNLSPKEIYDIYAPKGFYNFKLEGRTFDKLTLLSNLIKYMAKPEYHLYLLNKLMELIF